MVSRIPNFHELFIQSDQVFWVKSQFYIQLLYTAPLCFTLTISDQKIVSGSLFFQLFVGKKTFFFQKYFSIHTEKLHSIETKKIFQNFGKYFILNQNRLQTYSEISL